MNGTLDKKFVKLLKLIPVTVLERIVLTVLLNATVKVKLCIEPRVKFEVYGMRTNASNVICYFLIFNSLVFQK